MNLPTAKKVVPPTGGWKSRTYYVVDVACRSSNPIFRAILYVGFIPDGASPFNEGLAPLKGGYTKVMGGSHAEFGVNEIYYLSPVCEIPEMREQQ